MFAVSTSVRAQEPVMIDSFGRLGSEEFEARLDNVITEASKHPDAKIQLLIYRGEKESLGSPYRFYGKVQAYLNHQQPLLTHLNIPLKTFIPTFCDSKPEQTTEVWRLDSNETKSCPKEVVHIDKTTMFDNAAYDKNVFVTCCVSNDFGPQQAEASLNAFADLLKEYPDSKAYVFIYGGTDFYWIKDSQYADKRLTGLDKKRETHDFVRKTKNILVTSGVDESRIKIKIAGYRDTIGTVQMWIVPAGGEIPKPKKK